MRYLLFALLLLCTGLQAQPPLAMQGSDATRMAATVMSRWKDTGESKVRWTYEQGVMWKGLEDCWYNTGDARYFKYIQHHIDRLAEDHAHAVLICQALEKKGFVKGIMPVETNIIIFEVEEPYCARTIAGQLKDGGVLAIAISASQVRFVTHLDISPEMVGQVIKVIESL